MFKFPYKLYLVTDTEACGSRNLFEVVEAAVKGGVDIVQLREKNLPEKDFLRRAIDLKELLDKYHVPLIINDSLTVAKQSFSTGIHVGNNDISPEYIRQTWLNVGVIGYSLEDLQQLTTASALFSDYIALSPVFNTLTKKDTITEWGLEGVALVRSLTQKPLVAIGNVHVKNAKNIITAGADCLAVVSAICSAANPEKAAADIRNEIEKSITKR